MKHLTRRSILAAAPAVALRTPRAARPARAKNYGPGVTDSEIKIGNTVPYSGPGSSYGTIGKAQSAYYKMLNEQGGINGRKINFISYDDAYTPAQDRRNGAQARRTGRGCCLSKARSARQPTAPSGNT